MNPKLSDYIQMYLILFNPIRLLPNVSDCNQNLNLTFESTNKDNTIYYNIENLTLYKYHKNYKKEMKVENTIAN
jgi:hypothetical protein